MINNVVLTGRICKDVQIKQTPNGHSVCGFTIAVDRPKKKDGTKEADFIMCVAWNSTADFLAKYCVKGDAIALQGRIQTRNYKDTDGKTVYVTEVICDHVDKLTFKPKDTQQPEAKEETEEYTEYGITSEDLPF